MKNLSVKFILLGLLSASLHAQSTIPGTWTLYPPQAQTFQVSVQPPINADGSSVWSSKSTIPVQYNLQQSLGPVVFSSYQATNSYSYLDFNFSNNNVTFDQLSNLSAVYSFQSGNCQNGALRWSINLADGNVVFVYYGNVPAPFNNCISGTSGSNSNPNNQNGLNLLAQTFQTDPRFENGTVAPGTYVPYATILAEETGVVVRDVTLVLDGAENEAPGTPAQVLSTGSPMSVTVGLTDGTTATFVPKSSVPMTVCPTQPATIQISTLGTGGSYTVDESADSTVPDQGTSFRIVDCKYMYNLSGKSLGSGQYQVNAIINGTPAYQASPGTIFVVK